MLVDALLAALTTVTYASAATCPARFRLRTEATISECLMLENTTASSSRLVSRPCVGNGNEAEIFSWNPTGELRVGGRCLWGGDQGSNGPYVAAPVQAKLCPSSSDPLFKWKQDADNHIVLQGDNPRCGGGDLGCCMESWSYLQLSRCMRDPTSSEYPNQRFVIEPV